ACLSLPIFCASMHEARATALVSDRKEWDATGEKECLAENDDRTPAILAEREERLPNPSVLLLRGALGIFGGSGAPGGVGDYFGNAKNGIPISVGTASFVEADVLAVRPVWVSAQAHVMASTRLEYATVMTDVFLGY